MICPSVRDGVEPATLQVLLSTADYIYTTTMLFTALCQKVVFKGQVMEKGCENWQLQINIDTYRILFLNASCSLNQRMMLLGEVFCFVFFSYQTTVTRYLLRHCCIYMYVCCIFFQLKVCNRQSSAHFLLSWPGELQKVKSNTAKVMWRQGNRHKKIRRKMAVKCVFTLY